MLATTIKKWEQELVQQGLQQGVQQGVQQGLQQGLQQGMYEGEKRKALATALKLKQKGMSIVEIAEVTGLGIEEIQKL
jgi:flagellar biosynthesis/type III secretory pathway protein FliH